MSDETCHKVNCNDEHPRHTHHSNSAGDAGGAGAVISVDAGQANPNCPEGYIWAGLNCVKDDGQSTECSEGYKWNGEECLPDDGDFDWAPGFTGDINGDCVPCNIGPEIVGIQMNTDGMLECCASSASATRLDFYITINGGATWYLFGTVPNGSGTQTYDLQEVIAAGELLTGQEVGLRVIGSTADCEETAGDVYIVYWHVVSFPHVFFGACT